MFQAPAPVRPQAAADLVYFVMVDRFANGDPTNDGAIDPADPQAFHGGDLRGVIDHLDYLQELGVRTLWLSPIFEMRTEKFHGWGAFHGYWVRDPARLEPRFGDERTLRELSDGLEARGMRLVLDMVYNHVSFDSPLVGQHPGWFHPALTIEDWNDPAQLTDRQVHGLPDLDQSNPEVRDWLYALSLDWARTMGVDGFRIDAVRHLPLDFLAEMAEKLRAELGPDFWILGEDFQGDAGQLSASFAAGGFSAMFDFPLRYALVDVVCGGRPPARIASTLSLDRLYRDPNELVTFLDNHDLPRILTACGGDRQKVDEALLFQFMSRGTPALTWGTELYLEGGDEPDNRRDMPWERASGPGLVARLQALRERYAPGEGTPQILSLTDTAFAVLRIGPRGASLLVMNRGEGTFEQQVPPAILAGGRLVETLSVPEGAGAGPDAAGTLSLRGPGTAVYLFEASGPNGYAPLRSLLRQQEPALVTFEAAAPPGGSALAIVGAGPELGSWDPNLAPKLTPGDDGVWRATVQVPRGLVLAFKPVLLTPEGARWAAGEDWSVLVQADERVPVGWTGTP